MLFLADSGAGQYGINYLIPERWGTLPLGTLFNSCYETGGSEGPGACGSLAFVGGVVDSGFTSEVYLIPSSLYFLGNAPATGPGAAKRAAGGVHTAVLMYSSQCW